MPVYISLTTIPSRVNLIEPTIQSLLAQTYEITQIFVCIPMNNMRGEVSLLTLPEFLENNPKITVTRPEIDHGPIMKYIGSLDQIPLDSFVFICDDDMIYRDTCVEEWMTNLFLVSEIDRKKPLLPVPIVGWTFGIKSFPDLFLKRA